MAEQDDLISFIASMTGEGNLRVEENLGEGYVRLRVAEAERRQAKHDIQHVEDIVIEMLRNARDAHATALYVATVKEGGQRTLLFLDNGCGIPRDMHERIFDARVTSKLESMKMDRWGVHGRGMALYSIRENTQEACVMTSAPGLGSAFRVLVDTSELPERADQSTWPQAARDEERKWACVKGPHNIIRTVCEFALEEEPGCEVYLGSPAEIAATLYSHASGLLDTQQLLFVDSESSLPVVSRLAFAADAADFMRIAATLGIQISERTAHRILSGSIKPVRSVSSRLLRRRKPQTAPATVDLSRDRRGLKIAPDDLGSFSRALERDFGDLAERYYLTLSADPKIRVGRDAITVTFPIQNAE
ncbi:ATP-binding protein [[Collinsella] massiliensis]|uniref:ATP-binding protein n=1 Tax=[Collinsella] massiliensis TaxID=1232426 RepID=A0A1Y3XVP0_9ACTN|nr:ATP-binding protein [[Collinsella] massiliensis]OUN89181.1 ATP-binding protein [[Collinsella] massiliensis]